MSFNTILRVLKGGSGSGNFGHSGRPGKRGGSASRNALVFVNTISSDFKFVVHPIGSFFRASKWRSGIPIQHWDYDTQADAVAEVLSNHYRRANSKELEQFDAEVSNASFKVDKGESL